MVAFKINKKIMVKSRVIVFVKSSLFTHQSMRLILGNLVSFWR